MIKKIFKGQINSITVAALLVALSSLVSRFLGIFRDRILAGEFGAGNTLDVYYAAFRIPDLIFNLLVLGALSAGFVPILTDLIKDIDCKNFSCFNKDLNKKAWNLATNLLNILFLAIFSLSLLGIIFAPWLMKIITPGFDAEKMQAVVKLSRIMFLSPILLGISSVFGGILQSFKRFFVYSLSPILYNIGIILGALFFVPKWGMVGLAWGVVFGALMHMLVQLPIVFSLGYKYRLIFSLKDKNIRKILTMMVPRVMSLAISQLNLLIITVIASLLQEGSLAVFNFANNLQFFPISIFGISFAVAAFPRLSQIAFDKKKLVKEFSQVLRQVLFFIVPSTVLLLTLRAQIIRVIYGSGKFGWEDTILTMDTLAFFSISLFAQALIPLLVRVFYARHNSKSPFLVGLFSISINVFLSFYLANHVVCKEVLNQAGEIISVCQPMGVTGLALAFSISSIINFLILFLLLRRELGDLNEKKLLKSVIKFSISAIATGISVQGVKLLVWPYINMTTTFGVFIQGFSSGVVGIFVYMAFCSLLKSEEFEQFWDSIKRRINWKSIKTNDQGEARGI
jgi:putative peptidoglycan lipid II flippase